MRHLLYPEATEWHADQIRERNLEIDVLGDALQQHQPGTLGYEAIRSRLLECQDGPKARDLAVCASDCLPAVDGGCE